MGTRHENIDPEIVFAEIAEIAKAAQNANKPPLGNPTAGLSIKKARERIVRFRNELKDASGLDTQEKADHKTALGKLLAVSAGEDR